MSLEQLGLRPGHPVRFRRPGEGRWHEGVATGIEKDGSLSIRDGKGSARAMPIALVEVRAAGARGAAIWEPLSERAARVEQLRLL